MSAVCCGRFFNHVSLINNVYPSEPGEVGPRPSALSLLVFYAGSKPQKLEKVGAYLEKKLRLDMRKSRNGFVSVTLAILDALIENCSTHINIVSKSILRIVTEVLENPAPELFMMATTTFVKLSSVHSHATTSDKEFNKLYAELVRRFCDFCTYETSDTLMQQKMHLSGLKAIRAIVSSDSFFSNPASQDYVNQIVPAILTNIRNNRKKVEIEDDVPGGKNRRSITDDLFTDVELEHSAEGSMRELLSKANVTTLEFILSRILVFLDSQKEWKWSNYMMHMVRVLVAGVLPQYRYVLLSSILERLSDDKAMDVEAKITAVRMIKFIVLTDGASVSVVILEILGSLVAQLKASVAKEGFKYESYGSTNDPVVRFQASLVRTMGCLAVSVEYPEQMNDIIAFLANRLQLDSCDSGKAACTPSPVEGDLEARRRAILECMCSVITTRYENVASGSSSSLSSRRSSIIARAPVPLSLLVSTVTLLGDPSLRLRLATARLIHHLMSLEMLEGVTALPLVLSPGSHPTGGNAEFLAVLRTKIYECGVSGTNEVADYVALGGMLAVLLKRFFAEELIGTLPMLFRLENALTDGSIATPSRNRALGTLTLSYVLNVSITHNLRDLHESLTKLKEKRIESGEWSSVLDAFFVPVTEGTPDAFDNAILSAASLSFPADDSSIRVKSLIDRASVVAAVAAEPQVAKLGETGRQQLAAEFVPGEEAREIRAANFAAAAGRRASSNRPGITRSPSPKINLNGEDLPTVPILVNGSLAPQKPSSVSSEPEVSVIKVEDLKELLSGSRKRDSDRDSISVASLTKNKANVKGFLRNLSSVINEPKRSNSTTLPRSDVLHPRESLDTDRSRSPTDSVPIVVTQPVGSPVITVPLIKSLGTLKSVPSNSSMTSLRLAEPHIAPLSFNS